MAGNPVAGKFKEFQIVSNYKYGYRNREDVTNLPPGVLIVGSQNVLTNVSERVQIRQGYSLDGATSDVISPISASFDWLTRGNGEVHMRAGFITSAGNDGKLQYRYVDTLGAVTWRDLVIGATSVAYNFTTFWNTTESLREVLFVNGASSITAWNGATAVILSTTATTITKTGTTTWLDAGFYSAGNKSLIINGNTYTYTGGENSTTLTGVSGSPVGEANGSIVHQNVVTTANSTFTSGPPTTFQNGLIATLNNQVYLSSLRNPSVYLSKVNSYTDYSFSSPRQDGEGGINILDANIVGFVIEGSGVDASMIVSAGQDMWYKALFTDFVSATGASGQTFSFTPIKTGRRQGAISQAYMSNMKNNIITATNETTIDTMGLAESFFTQIQATNLSDPIKLDIDSYNFTDGSIYYFRYNIYVAVPKEGLVRVYNVATASWEAPQTLPISRFYIVSGELYGHSYNTSESYKLFTGYADRVYAGFNGSPIDAKWVFSFENYGSRYAYKKADYLYVEGYINANTVATCNISYELDGCQTVKSFDVDGSDKQIVCISTPAGSLGKQSLGKIKLGGDEANSINGLPPKFRVEKSFNNTNFFECSISFEVLGTDNRMELLAFGLNASMAPEEPVIIRQ